MIQDIDDGLYAPRRREILCDECRELALEYALHLADDLRRGAVHRRNALSDIGLGIRRQGRENGRRLLRLEISHDERYGLRMLVLDEVQQLRRIGLAQEIERTYLQTRCQAVQDVHSLLGTERLLEHALRILETAGRDIILGHRHLIELADDGCLLLRCHLLMISDLERDALDLIVIEMLEYLGRVLRPQRDKQYSGFFRICQFPVIGFAIHICHFLTLPPLSRS